MDPGDQPADTVHASIYTAMTGVSYGVCTLVFVLEIYGRDVRTIRKMTLWRTYLVSASFFSLSLFFVTRKFSLQQEKNTILARDWLYGERRLKRMETIHPNTHRGN